MPFAMHRSRRACFLHLAHALVWLAACSTPPAPTPPAPTVPVLTPTLSIAPIASPPAGRYLFLEVHRIEHPVGPEERVRFPEGQGYRGYYFDQGTGSLYSLRGLPYTLMPTELGLRGDRYTQITATGDRLSTTAVSIRYLPQSLRLFFLVGVQDNGDYQLRHVDAELRAVAADATIELSIDGQVILLAPGESWSHTDQVEVNTALRHGVYTLTHHITNFGWQDRARLQWSRPRYVVTTDGGVSWNLMRADVPRTEAGAWFVDCPLASACYMANGTGGGPLLLTSDGGSTWRTQFGLLASPRGISCPTTDTCMVLDSEALFLTTDNGETWSRHPVGDPDNVRLLGVECPVPDTCYAVGRNGLITVTSDGGRSWRTQTSGVPHTLSGVSCASARACFVVGFTPDINPEDGVILATTDGGHTWTQQSSAATPPLDGISCANATACTAVGIAGFVSTTDGGRTWTWAWETPVAGGSVRLSGTAVSCPAPGRCLVVNGGSPQGIWITHDGGNTWFQRVFWADEVYTFGSIRCPDADTCFAMAWPY